MSSAPRYFSVLFAAASAAAVSAPAHAQGLPVTLWTQYGSPNNSAQFGWSIAGLGDLNGDGLPERIVGAPAWPASQSGRAVVYSGTGATLFTFNGSLSHDHYGTSVAAAGDTTLDSKSEILIGAPDVGGGGYQRGRVELRNGASGALITSFTGTTDGMVWGLTVTGLGDLNGDGRSEYAFNGDVGGAPAIYVMNGATHTNWFFPVFPGGSMRAVANAGDVNGDGKNDLIVATTAGARVFSGANGASLFTITASLVTSVAGLGDVTGDGRSEFALGSSMTGPLGVLQGRVDVYSGANAALLWSRVGDGSHDEFGYALASLGDVDGDGIPDLAVGAPERQPGFVGLGYARILSGSDGCKLAQFVGTQNSAFGLALGNGGDIDGDGRSDLLVGDPEYPVGGVWDDGAAFAFKGALAGSAVGTVSCTCSVGPCGNPNPIGSGIGGCANSLGLGAQLRGFGSTSVAADDLFLIATNLPPTAATQFFSGASQVNGGFGGFLPTLDGLLCVNNGILRHPMSFAQNGVSLLGPCQVIAQAGFMAGQTRHFQAHYRDGAGPCGRGANTTNSVSITFTP